MTTLHLPVVSIIIPIHNEKNNIGEVINDFKKMNQREWEIIVVDDGSSDGSKDEIDTEFVRLITHNTNLGKGEAIKSGIQNAKGKFIVLMDGDGQDVPNDILKLLGLMNNGEVDLVIGARFKGNIVKNLNMHIREGSVQIINYFGNILLTMLINVLLNIRITDSQAGFKCMELAKAKELQLNAKGFEIETEILIHASKKKWIIKEVEVTRKSRVHGSSDLYDVRFGRIVFGLKVLRIILKNILKGEKNG